MKMIQVKIKNVSDDEIKDVSLFNYETEKENDLRYFSYSGLKYKELLNLLLDPSLNGKKIKLIRVQAGSYIKENIEKWFKLGSFCLHYKKASGEQSKLPLSLSYDPCQYQQGIVDINLDSPNIVLKNGINFSFNFIPADTSYFISIFFEDGEGNFNNIKELV